MRSNGFGAKLFVHAVLACPPAIMWFAWPPSCPSSVRVCSSASCAPKPTSYWLKRTAKGVRDAARRPLDRLAPARGQHETAAAAMERGNLIVAIAHLSLSGQPVVAAILPLFANLLGLCRRGREASWCGSWFMAGSEAFVPLPSVCPGRLRSRARTRRGGEAAQRGAARRSSTISAQASRQRSWLAATLAGFVARGSCLTPFPGAAASIWAG